MSDVFAMPELRYAPIGEVTARLVAAVVLAGLIGADREVRKKPVGFKTLMLVSLGAASFCVTVMEMIAQTAGDASFAHAPDRVIQGVIGGIGFLGAGAIIQEGARVRGVTTGATIWVTGGIGMACGFGFYHHAALVTGIALFVLVVLGWIEHRLFRSRRGRSDQTG
jgi:putative Mg2+ transporter-C (MgtC) family protein